MNIRKMAVKGSPFIGIFLRTTDKITLVPHGISQKERHAIQETLQTEIVPCSMANTPLIGVLCAGNEHGFVVPEIAEQNELKALQENGIPVFALEGVHAFGNLVSITDNTGICSPILSKKTIQAIEHHLKTRLAPLRVASSELVGAATVLNSKGFICNPNATKPEMLSIEKKLGIKGNLTSANFGDPFVGNSVVANQSGALAGLHSSAHELLAIEEAFSGEA